MQTPKARKQRHKGAVVASNNSLVSAAVSIDQPLYHRALKVANNEHEGNFSRYVRTLIKRDLKLA